MRSISQIWGILNPRIRGLAMQRIASLCSGALHGKDWNQIKPTASPPDSQLSVLRQVRLAARLPSRLATVPLLLELNDLLLRKAESVSSSRHRYAESN